VERIERFPRVSLIDLHINRIEATAEQFAYVKVLTGLMAARKGALVVWGNPIASTDALKWMSDFAQHASAHDESHPFFHLVWILEKWITDKKWLNVLGTYGSEVADTVAAAHFVFFDSTKSAKRAN
jgi:hypothetical protein